MVDPFGLEGFLDPVLDLGRVGRLAGIGILASYVVDQWRLSHGGLQGGLVGVTYFHTWTFFGGNFEALTPAAQDIIDAHEARHRAGMGEQCARIGTIYDVNLILRRGTYGQLLGQGGRPLSQQEITELRIIKGQSEYWIQLHRMSWWQRTRDSVRLLIY
jgi:hypothetical protein